LLHVEAMSRREFLARTFVAGSAGATTLALPDKAEAKPGTVGTMIDLATCIGCGQCMEACSTKNAERYPQPVADIPDNWPTGRKEDWTDVKHIDDMLTPYNWLYVEQVEVDGVKLNIPRRCMHCDNPPCAKLCPFSVQEKTPEGAVVINEDGCMGGAKCRAVCPWEVPQRQAGVGIYMKLLPGIVGGGVMYKCDLCADRLTAGQPPACTQVCPTGALQFGGREQMLALANARAQEIGGYIYGAEENGGTSTFYVSPVSFDKIDAAIDQRKAELPERFKRSVPGMTPGVGNYLDTTEGLATSYAIAPIAGIAAATAVAVRAFSKGGSSDE
jgi:formate dehydrogenase iron-sulfur subunit